MKKINFLMALMMAFTLSFVACTEPTPEPTPGPEDPTPSVTTFAVELGEVTSSSVAYTVTPSNLEAEYLCVLYDAETVEEYTRDEFLVQQLMMDLEEDARSKGKTLAEYMPSIVDKGAITDGLYEGLAPESRYYIVIFGVDAANDYAANTAVSKTEVTTAAAATLDVTFEIETEVDGNTATIYLYANDNGYGVYKFIVDENYTAVENVESVKIGAEKVIENGQIFILKNGVKYNALGAEVK